MKIDGEADGVTVAAVSLTTLTLTSNPSDCPACAEPPPPFHSTSMLVSESVSTRSIPGFPGREPESEVGTIVSTDQPLQP